MSEKTETYEEVGEPRSFGDTKLGEGIGCGFMLLGFGLAVASVIYAISRM